MFEGTLWAAALWTGVVLHERWRKRELPGLLRAEISITLVLLGAGASAVRSGADDVAANPIVMETVVRGALVTMGLLVILPILLGRLREHGVNHFPGMTGFFLYGTIAGLSALYSVSTIVTAGKVYELMVGFFVVLAVAIGPDPRQALGHFARYLIALGGVLVGAAVIGFFALPDTFSLVTNRPGFATAATLVSPFMSSNGVSAFGGLLATFAVASYAQSDRSSASPLWFLPFVLGSAAVVLGSARQGVAIWAVGVLVALWLYRRELFLLFLGPALAGAIWLNWSSLLEILARDQNPKTLATLSSRLIYWDTAFDAWLQHPWTGYGFGAGGRFVALKAIGSDSVSSLHNGYVEALIGVGILGLLPLLYVVWRVARWSLSNLRRRVDGDLSILIIPLVLHTGVSLGFGAWLVPDTVLMLCLLAVSDIDHSAKRSLRVPALASRR